MLSPLFSSDNGLRQGDNLSPTLFSCYIDGLLKTLKESEVGVELGNMKINVLAYVDDIVLLGNFPEKLQILVNIVNDWSCKWCVIVNTEKSKIVHFWGRFKKRMRSEILLGKKKLEVVSNYKYLGTLLDEFLNTDVPIDCLAKAGSRALGALIGKSKENFELGYGSYFKLYHSIIVPITDYGCSAWNANGHTNFNKLDQIQQRAIRFFSGLPKHTSLIGMEGDMGWTPGVVRRDVNSLRLYNQIIQMENTCLERKLFNYEKGKNIVNG